MEITHDLLQQKLEKLLQLLKERETECFTWHGALNESLSELHELLCPLFRKPLVQEAQKPAQSSSYDRKALALMIVIEKIIARYQNQHAGNLDEGIFKLFKIAKSIDFAKSEKDLQSAIIEGF